MFWCDRTLVTPKPLCKAISMMITTTITLLLISPLFMVAIMALPAVKALCAHVPTPPYTEADRELSHKAFEDSLTVWMEYEASEEAYNKRHENCTQCAQCKEG